MDTYIFNLYKNKVVLVKDVALRSNSSLSNQISVIEDWIEEKTIINNDI